MTPADDFAKAAYALAHPNRPAYVSYATSASAHGIAGDNDPAHTIYVRTKDGAVVQGSIDDFSTAHFTEQGDTNPVSRPAFEPACYVATSEQNASWQGSDAIRISLRGTCKDNNVGGDDSDAPFDTLYADAKTLEPLAATGTINVEGMSIDLEEHFARFGNYVFPSGLSAHVRGHGLLFWVRERAAVMYSDYKFYDRLPQEVMRRQAVTP